MIPKTIHYCWFGKNEKPALARKCIESWREVCSDYSIVEWNENNFDVTSNPYTKMCFETKQWAFLSDYVRLIVVYRNGGLYFDTDVEVIRNFDTLLNHGAFFGFENSHYIATGLGFGAVKEHPSVLAMIHQYKHVIDGDMKTVMCPKLNTEALIPLGLKCDGSLQRLSNNTTIYPSDYFNPLDDSTGQLKITENTYSINHYGKSWMKKSLKIRSKLTRPLHRLLGTDFFRHH